jgi:hypothetical protein
MFASKKRNKKLGFISFPGKLWYRSLIQTTASACMTSNSEQVSIRSRYVQYRRLSIELIIKKNRSFQILVLFE